MRLITSVFVKTAYLLLCIQQINLAACAAAGLANAGHPLSGSVHQRSPSPAFSAQPGLTGQVPPLNGTTPNNQTSVAVPAENPNAYCRDDPGWFGVSGDMDLEDCQRAILALRRDVYAGTDAETPFTWSYPGRDSRTSKFTPRFYTRNLCVLSVWPRYLAAEWDDEIAEAQPQGLHPSDVASLNEIGTRAYQVWDRCILGRQPSSPGWIPAGESSSLFVGFWERDSDWDHWVRDLQLGPLSVVNGSVATT